MSALLVVVASALVLAGGTGCRKKTPEERFQEVRDLFDQNKIVNAVLKSKELIRDFPDDPAAYEARAMLAFYYFQTGDPDRSHEYLEQIYKGLGLEDPRGFQALMQDVQIYQMQEDIKTGLATVEWALGGVAHDSPSSGELLLAKATLLTQGDAPEDGEALFRELMLKSGAKPMRDQSRELLAQYYRTKENWEKEIEVYAEFEKAFPDEALKPHFDVVQGLAAKKLGRTAEGQAQFERGIEALKKAAEEELEQGKAANEWMAIAQYYLVAEMNDEAVATLRAIREKFPQHQLATEAGVVIGDTFVRQKKWDDAIEMYEQVRDQNPLGPVGAMVAQRIQRVRQAKMQEKATSPTLEAQAAPASMTDEPADKEAAPTE